MNKLCHENRLKGGRNRLVKLKKYFGLDITTIYSLRGYLQTRLMIDTFSASRIFSDFTTRDVFLPDPADSCRRDRRRRRSVLKPTRINFQWDDKNTEKSQNRLS